MDKYRPVHNKFISVRGAREHNLQNINVDLPRDSLIVITGPSGSGKSSLAFDTIYAEGQRRYVESLSAYARQFLEISQKPDVDRIDGLSPAIAIEQKTTSRNPRSTVGTVTEIYDYMRLLFSRAGVPFSPATGQPIESLGISQIVDQVMKLEKNTRIYILSPVVQGRKGEYKKELAELQRKGFQRVKINSRFYDIEEAPVLNKTQKHDIEVVVDRIILNENIRTRLADSMETAIKLSGGLVVVEQVDKPLPPEKMHGESAYKSVNETHERTLFSQSLSCPISGFNIPEIEPRLFSFNSPFGACPQCSGLGQQYRVDPTLLIAEEKIPAREAVMPAWAISTLPELEQTLEKIGVFFGFKADDIFNHIPERAKTTLLYGYKSGNKKGKKSDESIEFEGLIPNLERQWKRTESNQERQEIESFIRLTPCPACLGARLKPESLAVKLIKKTLQKLVNSLSSKLKNGSLSCLKK